MRYSTANQNNWQSNQRITKTAQQSTDERRAMKIAQCLQDQGDCLACSSFMRPDECPLNRHNQEHLKALRIADLQRKIDFLKSRTPTASTLIAGYTARIQALQAN